MLTLPFVAALVAAGAERARPRAVLVGALVVDLLIGSRLSLPTQSIRESFPGSVAESIRAGWRGDGAPSLWDYGYHTLRRGDDGPLLPNLAALQGFDYVLGRQGYALNRPHQLVTHTKPLPPEAHVRVMRRTSADYLYGPPEIRSLSTLGLIPVREGHPTVLSDPLAWPFAALSTRIRLVDRGRDALDAVASGDPGSFVIRAEWPEGVPVPPDGDSPRIPVVCDRPRSDRVDCALPGLPGLARFATAWAPGWTATFDGGAARAAIPVDHALLGVIVPAGAKSLSLRYRAPGADLGLVVSVLCSSGLLLGWLRRRR
jgi:hypothetical protein